MYFYGGTTLLQWWLNSPQRKESCAIFPFFYRPTLPVVRLLQLVPLSHYIKQVNPPKFYLQYLVWGSYLSSLQNGIKCKTWLNSPGSPLLWWVLYQNVTGSVMAHFVDFKLSSCAMHNTARYVWGKLKIYKIMMSAKQYKIGNKFDKLFRKNCLIDKQN